MGGHGVGKTKLVSKISQEYGLRLLSETARTELARTERSFDDLRTDLEAVSQYQRRVFSEQIRVEREAGDCFVSDRAFDNLAYLCAHGEGFGDLAKSQEAQDYARHVAAGLVFWVRPLPTVVADGVRAKTDLDLASVWRIDGMVQILLELFDIKGIPVSCHSFKDRWSLVRGVIDLKRQAESLKP